MRAAEGESAEWQAPKEAGRGNPVLFLPQARNPSDLIWRLPPYEGARAGRGATQRSGLDTPPPQACSSHLRFHHRIQLIIFPFSHFVQTYLPVLHNHNLHHCLLSVIN